MRGLACLLALFWAILSCAEEASSPQLVAAPKSIYLASITSDYSDKKYELSLEVDTDNRIVKIKTYNVNKNKFREYGLDVLKDRIALVKAAGIELITLRCLDFNPDLGCRLEIHYPQNIAVANFGEFYAKLVRTKDSWEIQTEEGLKFERLHLIAKKAIGLLVGIKRIEIY